MSQVELEQALRIELNENPALERIDDHEEPITDYQILEKVAPAELKPSSDSREFTRSLPQDDHSDWLDFTASNGSLWDHLSGQMHTKLPNGSDALIDYLIGSVNDRGYITCTVEDAALATNSSLEEAEDAWQALRSCEPAGVGATDLKDCLSLQLRDAKGDPEKLAREVLKHSWEDLVNKNKNAIAKTFKADEELVEQSFEVILNLNPFPGEAYALQPLNASSDKVVPIQPDVIITLDTAGWIVEVPGPSPIHLMVNRAYSKKKDKLANSWQADPAEKRHVNEFVDRAHRFLDALTQRRQNMARLGKYLVENQGGFVKTGEYKFLLPLTRSQVAKDLNLHESTISRATSGKFIQIANGDVISFDVFFKPALRVQKMIEEILESENPNSPLSDESIRQLLSERGIEVARRTVNKYRDKTKLLSSRLRKGA